MSQWSRATVNIDYHIAFDGNFYSVPYILVQQVVEVRSTPTTVEIFHRENRIASHLRSRRRGQAITQNEHRPKSHQAHGRSRGSCDLRRRPWYDRCGGSSAAVQCLIADPLRTEQILAKIMRIVGIAGLEDCCGFKGISIHVGSQPLGAIGATY